MSGTFARRRAIALAVMGVFAAGLVWFFLGRGEAIPTIRSQSAYVYNLTDDVEVLSINGDEPRAPGSLAVNASGSRDAFVAEMNTQADALGLTSTHFVNPEGYDADGQVTTAAAGRNWATIVEKDDTRYVIVVMGAPLADGEMDSDAHILDTLDLAAGL